MMRRLWIPVAALLVCTACLITVIRSLYVPSGCSEETARPSAAISSSAPNSGPRTAVPAASPAEASAEPTRAAAPTPSAAVEASPTHPADPSPPPEDIPDTAEGTASDSAEVSQRLLQSALGEIKARESSAESAEGTYLRRDYEYPGGDRFSCVRLCVSDTPRPVIMLESLHLDGEDGTVRYYDGSQWSTVPLEDTVLDYGMYFISTNRQHMIICLPAAYADREGVLEYLPKCLGRLTVQKDEDGWTLNICCRYAPAGSNLEYMYLVSDRRLIDWSMDNAESDWAGFLFTGNSRWTYDGYFYVSPENYYPAVPNSYFSLPAAYIVSKFVSTLEIYRASKLFVLPMLDIMCFQQNDMGFFPTPAGSTWLLEEYGIGMGFFDTRFNADLIIAMTGAIDRLEAGYLVPTVTRFADFFEAYVLTKGIIRGDGILLPDYWHPDGCKTTHTSLNHQCAQALMAFNLYDLTNRTLLYDIALSLIRGIDAEADFWKSGPYGNLNYAWYEGTAYGTDYPYLTYDDMVKLQRAVEKHTGSEDPVLQDLVSHKLYWMIYNNITGYITQ